MASAEDYAQQLGALLPRGRIWSDRPESVLRRLLAGLGAILFRVHQAADELMTELYPPSSVALLPDYEELLGLPDACTPAGEQTIQERRARVVERLTIQPRPTLLYLQSLAAALGYGAVLEEGPGLFEITATVALGRVTYFRVGESSVGDSLGKFDQALDLECLLREAKPAHVLLTFNYTGA